MRTFARIFVAISLAAPLVLGARQAFSDDGYEDDGWSKTWNAPLAISPTSGPVTGGTKVKIAGRGFYEVRRVTLGGIPLSQIAVNSSRTVITGVTGAAAAPGKVDLVIYRDDNILKLAGAFTYTAANGATISLATGNNQAGVAGSTLGSPFVVTAKNAGGTPVAGLAVTFTVTSGGGTLSASTVPTDAQGQAQSTLTLGKIAGVNLVTASASASGSPITFTATGKPGAAAQVALASGNNQNGAAGSPLAAPLVVTVTDANANAVQGFSVTFAVTAGGGTLSATSVATNASGQGQTSLTLGTAGANTVTAAATGLAGSPVTFTETATAAAATQIALTSGNTQVGVAGSALANPLVVTVKDAGGNPVAGFAVTFGATGGGTLSATNVATNAQGQAQTSLTLGKTAGPNTVTATATGLAGSPITFSESGTAGPAKTVALTSGNNQNGAVGAPLAAPLVVTVTDANANPVSGFAITFAVTAGGGTLSTTSVATNASGQSQTSLTLGAAAGANTVTATATGLGGSPVTFTETATAAAATQIALISGNTQVGAAGSALANPLVVTVKDAGGNPVAGFSVTFAATGGGTLSASVVATNAQGQAQTSLTLGKTAGPNTVTATAAGLAGSPITFTATGNAGPAAKIALTSGNNQSAGVNTVLMPFVVTVSDANGNAVANFAVNFAVASGGGTLSALNVPTNAQGQAQSTLTLGTTAGATTVTANATGLSGSPCTFAANATAVAYTYVNDIQPLFASRCVNCHGPGGVEATTPLNTYTAILTGKTAFALTPPAYVVPGNPTNSLLVAMCEGTVANAPNMATYGGFTPAQVQIVHDWVQQGAINSPATQIAATSGNSQSGLVGAALPTALVATVKDASGYAVYGVTVTFAVTAGGGTLSATSVMTDASGNASTTLTLGTAAGANTVTATAAGLTPAVFTENGTTTPPLTYTTDVGPLLAAHCTVCHGPGGVEAACPLDTYAAVTTGKTIFNLTPASYVVAGNPTNSLLVQACGPTGTVANLPLSMATYGGLTPAQVQTISDWVSQGAKQ